MFWVNVIVSPAAAVLRALMSCALFATLMFPAKAGDAKNAAPPPSRRASVNREVAPRRARAEPPQPCAPRTCFGSPRACAFDSPPVSHCTSPAFPARPRVRDKKIRANPGRPMTPNNGGHGTPGVRLPRTRLGVFSPSRTPRFFSLHEFREGKAPRGPVSLAVWSQTPLMPNSGEGREPKANSGN